MGGVVERDVVEEPGKGIGDTVGEEYLVLLLLECVLKLQTIIL